jgi:hypothetical protein
MQKCSILERTSGNASGTIEIEGHLYSSSSEITSEFIHTSAEKIPASGFKSVILEGSSSAVKKLLITKVAEHFDVDSKELQLKKDAHGMPFLSRKEDNFFDRFSFSGHGRYSACSLSLINCETSVKQS